MRSDDVVFDAQCAGLLVKAMLPDLQQGRRCRGGKQGNASAKEHRNHSNFDAINQAGAKQASKELAASENSDVLAGLLTQRRDEPYGVVTNDSVRVVRLSQRSGKDNVL